MKIKEILGSITDYIRLSPIANKYYGKSRQWLYHKINQDVINNVQYELSDDEIDTLILALDDIRNSICSSMEDLEDFKEKREYLKIPEETRTILENHREQWWLLSYERDAETKRQNFIREIYTSTTNPYVLELLNDWISSYSLSLLNLENYSTKYDGKKIKELVTQIMTEIHDKLESKRKKVNKKTNNTEDEDDDYEYEYVSSTEWEENIYPLSCKIYYQSNKLSVPKNMQDRIHRIPDAFESLGNIKRSEIEKMVIEKLM